MCYNGESLISPSSPIRFSTIFFLLFAAFTKSAQFPFISWLPLAMAAPTPISALVHSSTLVTSGVFLIYRCFSFSTTIPQSGLDLLILIGVVTSLIGRVRARLEYDVKKCIAFSTLRHCGLMTIGLGTLLLDGVLFHLIAHAILKSILFILAGKILENNEGKQDIRHVNRSLINLGGATCFFLNALNIISIPFLGLWYSKHIILRFSTGSFIISLIIIVLTFFSYFYIVRLTYFFLFKKNETTISLERGKSYVGFILIHLLICKA